MSLYKCLQEVKVGGHLNLPIVVTEVLNDLIEVDLYLLLEQRFIHLGLQGVHCLQGHDLPLFGQVQLGEEEGQDLLEEGILRLPRST